MIPVVIIGGGPAGAGTAIALRQLGIACVVIDDGKTNLFKPGESLPPNAQFALNQLSVTSLLQAHAHYVGNTVVWGNDAPLSRYFLNEPLGNGWHLDRVLFEQQLRTKAEELGALWLDKSRFTDIVFSDDKPFVHCTNSNGTNKEIEACFVIDCSGRASVVAKKMGIKKQVIDRLVAFCFTLQQAPQNLSGLSFIEAVEDGYWYAAPISSKQIVVNYMTDSDLHSPKTAELQDWLFEKIKSTPHLSGQLQITAPQQLKDVQIKTASTSFLEQSGGVQWLAVGDALCTYDPLTSFGITHALSSGYQAALAIQGFLNGDLENMSKYISIQQDTFNKCMGMLQAQYGLEQRWASSPFWQKRRGT